MAREEWLESPEAIRQREESRTAFDDLATADAEGVLNSVFEEALKQLDGDPARALSDMKIEEVVSENGALVGNGNGGMALVESPIPIRSEVPGEESKAVNLDLKEAEGGFEPKSPATDIKLPASLGGQVEVGEEIAFASLPGNGEVAATRFGDKDLFYPNTNTDTDTFIAPLAQGVEVFQQLRSPKSPEQFRYGLKLPQGTTLRPDGEGGAEAVNPKAERVASVPAPFAIDAQGTKVPVSMTIEGNAVVVEIAHRSLDVAYPLLLDPELVNDAWYWEGNGPAGLEYWAWTETADYENGYWCTLSCWGWGLYARSKGNNHGYGPNTYGQWIYTAPNSTAYIAAATFWTIKGNSYNCITNEPHGYVGIYNVYSGSYNSLGVYSPPSGYSPNYQTGWVGGNGTRLAVVGVGTGSSLSQLACGHDFYVAGALLSQDDPEAPGVSLTGMPSGWISDTTPGFTLTAKGYDPGLGVRKITFTRDGTSNGQERLVGCNGMAGSRCPVNRSEQFSVTALSFDEGKKNAYMTVEDATGEKSTHTWQTYVDLTKPDVVLTGQLAVATQEDKGGEQGDKKVEELSLPVYNLAIKATDIGTESNPDHRKRSGVRKIEVLLDDIKKQEWTQACSDSCSMEKTYSLRLNNLSAGEHVLKVIAEDGVKKTRERTIEFEYIPATGMKDEYVMQYFPLPDGSGIEAEEENPDRPELAVNVINGNLVYREKDVDVEGYSVDLEIERYYNSLLPEAEDTEWGDGWTLAQTPDLEPEAGPTADEAMMVRSSGAVEGSIELPVAANEEIFDPELQAVVSKEADGGYEVADATGETDTRIAFDESGTVEQLRTEGEAVIDYSYDQGDLAEMTVDEPASFSGTAEEATKLQELASGSPLFSGNLGSSGTGDGQFYFGPGGVDRDSQGNFWVADTRNRRIQKFNSDFEFLSKIDKTGGGENEPIHASALAIDSQDNVWIGDWSHHRIEVFDKNGDFVRRFGSRGSAPGQFEWPEGLAIDPDGNVWVADKGNGRVQKFDPDGNLLKVVGSKGTAMGQLQGPQAIDIAPNGDAWVVDWVGHSINVFDAEGQFRFRFGSLGSDEGEFHHPVAISVDHKGRVWVADQVNDRVQQFNQAGEFVRQFGFSGSGGEQFDFVYPADIETDDAGNLWITDGHNERVKRWRASRREIPTQDIDIQDDPAVKVEVSGDLVESVAGEEAGEHVYEHDGDLLTSHEDEDGRTTYEYDGSGRMTRIELPNGTWAEIQYGETDGRVKKVTVDPEGLEPAKTTEFSYVDAPQRSTTVILPNDPKVTYEIGEDGAVFKWRNAKVPPEFEVFAGTLVDIENKETATPLNPGNYELKVTGYAEEGMESIQIYANGNQLLSEKTCPAEELCKKLPDEWVTYTGNHAPGILNIEVVIEDRFDQVASKRFWVNIPYTPPPPPGQPVKPQFGEVLQFREEHGLDLDLDPIKDESELNDRVFDTINDWVHGDPVAVASWERWGAPLRTPEVAELEYRIAYWKQAMAAIPVWAGSHAGSAFAGFFLDERAGGKIRVGFTGGGEAQKALVSTLIGSGAVSASDRIAGFTNPPQHSLGALDSLAVQVQTTISSFPIGIASRAFVDVRENRVTAVASNVLEAKSRLDNAFGAGAPIGVISGEPLQARGDRERVNGPMLAGDRIWTKEPSGGEWGCSAGFGAYDYGTKPATGQRVLRMFFLIAAHCGEEVPGTTSNRSSVLEPKPKQRQKLGTVKRSGWDAANGNVDLDVEAVRYEEVHGIEPRRIFNPEEGATPIPITGVGTVGIGTRVCYSGATTDENHPYGGKCGTVFEFTPYILEEELPPHIPHRLEGWCFDRASEEGDSGGPVWIEGTGTAVGLVSAGDARSTCFASLLPDAQHPATPGALIDGRLAPLDGLTLRP